MCCFPSAASKGDFDSYLGPLLQRRDAKEVRKRGQWRTYSSLRRYEKSGRLQQVLQTTPADVLRYCQGMEDRLLQLLRGPASAVPPPPRP